MVCSECPLQSGRDVRLGSIADISQCRAVPVQVASIALMRMLVAAFALLTIATSATAQTVRGRVVSVADGDTITVQTEDKRRVTIRLQGIDAPERTMPYSQVS